MKKETVLPPRASQRLADPPAASDQQRQQRRLATADAFAFLDGKHRVGIFGGLLGGLEILLVQKIVLVLAVLRRVIATDQRPVVVNAAAIVALQVFALGVNQQVPRVILLENRGS